jgi:hypothetical protein
VQVASTNIWEVAVISGMGEDKSRRKGERREKERGNQ